MIKTTLRALVVLAAVSFSPVVLANCGDGPANAGEFHLTVSGAGAATACGKAVFPDATDQFGMQFLSNTDITMITVFTGHPGRPGPGTYPIVDFVGTRGDPGAGVFTAKGMFDPASLNTTLTSVSGTITIDSSTPNGVAGSLEMTARIGMGAAEYTINATFSALPHTYN